MKDRLRGDICVALREVEARWGCPKGEVNESEAERNYTSVKGSLTGIASSNKSRTKRITLAEGV